MAGIYVHIPFCSKACHYCDFHFSTNLDLREGMVNSIVKEIAMQKGYLGGEEISTIYFGGGTPSLMGKESLLKIIKEIKAHNNLIPDTEITLEANPDDLDEKKLHNLRSIGINRLSIGVQSFRDDVLKFFNRSHNSSQSVTSVNTARSAGFDNISIDLIYGIPNQDNEAWRAGIQEALSLRPEHISAYSLTIEERTVFGKWKASNKLMPMNEELVAQQFEMLMDILTQKGYDHYEISNFSLPDFHSRHNSSYWRGTRYLGVGPSAHSYDGRSRQFNVSNNSTYIRKIESGEVPFEREVLTREDKINEYFFIGLRTAAGCNLDFLMEEYAFGLSDEQENYIEQLVELGTADFNGHILKLTNKGKLLADKIASDLFVNNE
ncbi:MAG TPA: radical SAM family heme chaperone HemW [Cyclobacteriaceae bacterium]